MAEKKYSTPFEAVQIGVGGLQCKYYRYDNKAKMWHCSEEAGWVGTNPCLSKDMWVCPIAVRASFTMYLDSWHKRKIDRGYS